MMGSILMSCFIIFIAIGSVIFSQTKKGKKFLEIKD
jgi:hypothetical protein